MDEVGVVYFEDANALPAGTMYCTRHTLGRPFSLTWRGHVYEQNHRTSSGAWVYKQVSQTPGDVQHTDPSLREAS